MLCRVCRQSLKLYSCLVAGVQRHAAYSQKEQQQHRRSPDSQLGYKVSSHSHQAHPRGTHALASFQGHLRDDSCVLTILPLYMTRLSYFPLVPQRSKIDHLGHENNTTRPISRSSGDGAQYAKPGHGWITPDQGMHPSSADQSHAFRLLHPYSEPQNIYCSECE